MTTTALSGAVLFGVHGNNQPKVIGGAGGVPMLVTENIKVCCWPDLTVYKNMVEKICPGYERQVCGGYRKFKG